MPNALTLTTLLALAAHAAAAQAAIIGRVLTDSGAVIAGAEVVLDGPQNLQRTDEKGAFQFARVPVGLQVLGVRMPGFAPRVDTQENGARHSSGWTTSTSAPGST